MSISLYEYRKHKTLIKYSVMKMLNTFLLIFFLYVNKLFLIV